MIDAREDRHAAARHAATSRSIVSFGPRPLGRYVNPAAVIARPPSTQVPLLQSDLLAARQGVDVEALDQALEQPVPVDRGAQMDEHGAEPDGGAVHEHELARRAHAAHAAQLAEHVLRHLAAVAFDHALGQAARTVVHQRAVEEGGPAIEHGDHLAAQAA